MENGRWLITKRKIMSFLTFPPPMLGYFFVDE
jgi:hypothetical protein